MLNSYPLTIQLIASATLILLWLHERQRAYLLWWGIAQITFPIMVVAASQIQLDQRPGIQPAMVIHAAMAATIPIAFLQGALLFRGIGLAGRYFACGWLLFFGVVLTLVCFEQTVLARFILSFSTVIADFSIAVLFWRLGFIERVISISFAARGLGVIFFGLSVERFTTLAYSDTAVQTSSIVTLVTVLLLLVASFYRAQQERETHFRFLSTTNEISARLQGVLDEDEVGACAIDVILKQHLWDSGTMLLLDESGHHLNVRIMRGGLPGEEVLAAYKKISMDGMSGLAFNTRKVVYSLDISKDDRIPAERKAALMTQGTICQVDIPIVSNDQMLGILYLRDNKKRKLLPNELQTLESLGKTLGVYLENIRNVSALSFRATHDSLTGLGNREALHAYFSQSPAQSSCVLMLFDLDHFKDVNDSLGHITGDRLLQALALRLQDFVAENGGEVFRLGGDEFVIVSCEPASEDDCMALALALSRLVSNPVSLDELVLRASASIGVARYPIDAGNSHELLRCADAAMYHAKRNEIPIAFYDTSIDAIVRERTLLLNGVSDALERNELELFYQPLIDIKTGDCVGCEALIRWIHPKHGLLPAGDFMPFVEKTDAIGRITHTVIEQAALQLDAWARQGIHLKMSINFSARNIVDNEVVGYLMKMTKEQRIDPTTIQIEITETTLMKDPAAATIALRHLRDAGFSIALDDYGTGYSSLAYLASFPIDVLKIDKSFVQRMENEPRAQAIIESTIALAHKLDLRVTAEGIENTDECNLLAECACDFGQGYLFGKPMTAEQFSEWLRATRAPWVKNLA